MKLIKCNIENYGTLNKFNYDFNDGLNIINKENGFGKTTLASFIKAMFYGLENINKSKVGESERKKYMPWNEGKFGGSLDFEYQENVYRIERFFGQTTKGDKIKVIDLATNLDTLKFGENIGEQIFGIDKSSFEKSTFFPQLDLNLKHLTDNIHQKLISLVEYRGENGFKEAKERLEAKSREYYYNKSNGLIVSVNNEISKLEDKISLLKNKNIELINIKNKLLITNEELLRKEKEINEIKITIENNYSKQRNISLKNQYNKYIEKIETVKDEILKLNEKGIPSDEELAKINESIKKITQNDLVINSLSKDDNRLINLNNHNISSLTSDELNKIANKINQIELSTEIIKTYNAGINFIKDEELESISLDDYNIIKNFDLKLLEKTNNNIVIILFLFIVLLSGIAFIFPYILILAFVCLVTLSVLLFKNKMINDEKKQKINEISEIFNIKDTDYNLFNQKVNKIKLEYQQYILNKKAYIESKEKLDKKIEEKTFVQNEICLIKEKYKYSNLDDSSFINQLRNDLYLFEEIKYQKISNTKTINELINNNDAEKRILYEFEEKYNLISNELVSQAEKRIRDHKLLSDKLANLHGEKERFLADNEGLSKLLNVDILVLDTEKLLEDEKDLTLKKERLIVDKAELFSKISILEKEVEEITALEEELDEHSKKLLDYKNEKKVIDKTIELLEVAKQRISSNYLKPLEQSFQKYISKIDFKQDEYSVDINLNVNVNKYGETYEASYLSKGYQDLVNICVRLALVDKIFKNEKPVLILDDPFVNLDEDKLDQAKQLLKEISKEYQVIYLICHSSRM